MTTIREAKHELVRFPLVFRELQVVRTELLNPRMIRVTLGGEALSGFASEGPEDHVKVIFPASFDERPMLPVQGPDGPSYPEGTPRPVMRDYTPGRFNAETCELDIDFYLHGTGTGSDWAAQAKPGQSIGIAGPRGSHVMTYDFDWYLLIGDETSIPGIARRLSELPEGVRTFAFIEVKNVEDEQILPTETNATIVWLHRDEAEPGATNLAEKALQWFELPAGDGYTWATGEATSLRSLRRYLLNERQLPKQLTSFSGHWKRGAADFDHHEEIAD